MYKIIFFVPLDSAETIKQALFDIGAGTSGNYKECCFTTKVVGQFRPIGDANPTIGQVNKLEHVDEYRIEMICKKEFIETAIKELKRLHPYEEPAYETYKLLDY